MTRPNHWESVQNNFGMIHVEQSNVMKSRARRIETIVATWSSHWMKNYVIISSIRNLSRAQAILHAS